MQELKMRHNRVWCANKY